MPSIKRQDFQAELEKHASKAETLFSGKKTYQKDERYWVPVKDKAGSAEAILRFLFRRPLAKTTGPLSGFPISGSGRRQIAGTSIIPHRRLICLTL